MADSLRLVLPLVLVFAAVAFAQIPNIGRCPQYDAVSDFDRQSFLGKWYEIARYFTVSEALSKCVSVEYERRSDGKIYANHETSNRFTGVQRIVSGVMTITGKNDEATFTIRYNGIPLATDQTIHVLDTDYYSYAVLWSCNGVAGPVGHTVQAWILTRERVPDGPVLQAAYGVLDRYKISRTFFVNTDQNDCETKGQAEEAADEAVDSGYDIVVNDQTIAEELFNNNYGSQYNDVIYSRDANGTAGLNATGPSTEAPAVTSTLKKE